MLDSHINIKSYLINTLFFFNISYCSYFPGTEQPRSSNYSMLKAN